MKTVKSLLINCY